MPARAREAQTSQASQASQASRCRSRKRLLGPQHFLCGPGTFPVALQGPTDTYCHIVTYRQTFFHSLFPSQRFFHVSGSVGSSLPYRDPLCPAKSILLCPGRFFPLLSHCECFHSLKLLSVGRRVPKGCRRVPQVAGGGRDSFSNSSLVAVSRLVPSSWRRPGPRSSWMATSERQLLNVRESSQCDREPKRFNQNVKTYK